MSNHEAVPFSSAQYIPFAVVEDYPSASQNGDPSLYPGKRPNESYITDGSEIFSVNLIASEDVLQFTVPTATGETALDDFLQAKGVPTMDERIPLLAFGANMAPGSLAQKFKKDMTPSSEAGVGQINNRPDLSVVPTIYGTLPGHDVVWSGGPGVNGNFIAILYDGPEVQKTSVQVGINFLTPEQLLMMHATELSYNLATTDVTVGGKQIQAYYYAGIDSVYLQQGQPVAVDSIPASNRSLAAITTEQLTRELFHDTELVSELASDYPELATVTSPDEYYAYIRTLKSKDGSQPRLALKTRIHAALAVRDQSRIAATSSVGRRPLSWANPSTLATYGQLQIGKQGSDVYRLPSQELPKAAWRNQAARDKVLRSMAAHLVRTSGGRQQFAPIIKK